MWNLREAEKAVKQIHGMGLKIGDPKIDFSLYVDEKKGPLADQVIAKMIKQDVPFMIQNVNGNGILRIWVEEKDARSLSGINYSVTADT
jgi:hypothetical protein